MKAQGTIPARKYPCKLPCLLRTLFHRFLQLHTPIQTRAEKRQDYQHKALFCFAAAILPIDSLYLCPGSSLFCLDCSRLNQEFHTSLLSISDSRVALVRISSLFHGVKTIQYILQILVYKIIQLLNTF